MNSWLFLSLLLAHVIGDFYLQNDKYCARKAERKFKSWFLYVHSLIIGGVSWAVVANPINGLQWKLLNTYVHIGGIVVHQTCQYPD